MKYHINKDGIPAICRATKRPCPLGGSEVHFNNLEDAQAYIDKQHQEAYGLMGPRPRKYNRTTVEVYNKLDIMGYRQGMQDGEYVRDLGDGVSTRIIFNENGTVEYYLDDGKSSRSLTPTKNIRIMGAKLSKGRELEEDFGPNYVYEPKEAIVISREDNPNYASEADKKLQDLGYDKYVRDNVITYMRNGDVVINFYGYVNRAEKFARVSHKEAEGKLEFTDEERELVKSILLSDEYKDLKPY